jgi:hypothetical protein
MIEREINQKKEDQIERSHESKRLKVEKRRQYQHLNQKEMLQHYQVKKKETESLLRMSFDKQHQKFNTTTPEFQFSNSYMKKRVKGSNTKGEFEG